MSEVIFTRCSLHCEFIFLRASVHNFFSSLQVFSFARHCLLLFLLLLPDSISFEVTPGPILPFLLIFLRISLFGFSFHQHFFHCSKLFGTFLCVPECSLYSQAWPHRTFCRVNPRGIRYSPFQFTFSEFFFTRRRNHWGPSLARPPLAPIGDHLLLPCCRTAGLGTGLLFIIGKPVQNKCLRANRRSQWHCRKFFSLEDERKSFVTKRLERVV